MSNTEQVTHSEQVRLFELGAAKKGYYFDRDPIDNRYVDNFLQEAWEVHCLVGSASCNEIAALRDEVGHYRNQLDLSCKDTLTPADAKKIKEANAQFASENFKLSGDVERLKDQLNSLATATKNYRNLHDMKGGDHIETGRAWDLMRREERKSIELSSK